ncbi:glycosyltransferase [uncultured Aquimarina sp.]|uniref:glycosyltransferase family 2 protein n=1 Tax=uncultured Aquimarina sp. TaxID=575652 RepID=UPI002637F4E7|nr:glycosyltransferase [uncultured Aquimarina sp.]
MLSILIPVYNYNTTSLINEIHEQAIFSGIDFEILVFDDGSNEYTKENCAINTLSFSEYRILPNNIGRSAIRNSLASTAQYDFLLFLDADIEPYCDTFIKKYVEVLTSKTEIISGGLLYKNTKPKKDQMLRWKYGHKKESVLAKERKEKPYLSFLSSNFLIRKSLFKTITFNENIPNLACEDTLFALDAKAKGITIEHIHNPVFHLGLENNNVFLKKSLESVEVRQSLIQKRLLKPTDTKITDLASKIEKNRLRGLVVIFHKCTEKLFKKNLISHNPSLLIFDLYRLGHYFQQQKK